MKRYVLVAIFRRMKLDGGVCFNDLKGTTNSFKVKKVRQLADFHNLILSSEEILKK